jgi:Xaa-Pro aminopeptidase
MAPIDQRLIDPALLTDDEVSWINEYHANVAEALSPLIDAGTRFWLKAATRPLTRG